MENWATMELQEHGYIQANPRQTDYCKASAGNNDLKRFMNKLLTADVTYQRLEKFLLNH